MIFLIDLVSGVRGFNAELFVSRDRFNADGADQIECTEGARFNCNQIPNATSDEF